MEMTIGRRIAQLRREKGLTQEELSQMMEVSAQAVSKWENDQTVRISHLCQSLLKF